MSNSSGATPTDAIFSLVRAAMETGSFPIRCSKSLLGYLSHTLEYIVHYHRVPALVCAGFQHMRYWLQEAPHYEALAECVRQVWVFAEGVSPLDRGNIVCIPLQDAEALQGEWFVVVWCPPLAVVLCARDTLMPVERESMRQFDLCWSFDSTLVEHVLTKFEPIIATTQPEWLTRFRDVQEEARMFPLAPTLAAQLARSFDHFNDQIQTKRTALRHDSPATAHEPAAASMMIAHDLRTQLYSLVTALDILGLSDFDPLRRHTFLRAAQASATQLTALVEVLFDTNTPQAAPFSVTWELLYLPRLIDEAIQPLMPLLDAAGVTLVIQITQNVPPIWADQLLTLRVFHNIISNAVGFTPSGGYITIKAHLDAASSYLVVSISDTGRGIGAEQLAHLFQQPNKFAAPLPKRTGIGLVFCRLAMEAQRGEIQLASELDVGTTVTLTFCTQQPLS